METNDGNQAQSGGATASSEVAATNSPSNTNSPKEETMQSNSNTTDGSTASTHGSTTDSSNGATTASSKPATGGKPNRGRKFDPAKQEATADKVIRDGATMSDAVVTTDVAFARLKLAAFQVATGARAVATANLEEVEKNWQPVLLRVTGLVIGMGAQLVRLGEGGRQLYADSDSRDMWLRGSKLLSHMPPGGLGMSTALTSELQTELTSSQSLREKVEAAKAAKVAADQAWSTAKAELQRALVVLNSAIRFVRLHPVESAKKAEAVQATPTAAKSTGANGHSNGSHAGA